MVIHTCRVCGQEFFKEPLLRYENMPKSAIPKIRKGMESIQINGYRIKARIAIGQQSIKRIIQTKNVIIE